MPHGRFARPACGRRSASAPPRTRPTTARCWPRGPPGGPRWIGAVRSSSSSARTRRPAVRAERPVSSPLPHPAEQRPPRHRSEPVRVAVLGGGRSSEHEVSLESAKAVHQGLGEAGHEPLAVEISREGRWSHEGEPVALEPGGGLLGAEVVFPALHGPYGEDGVVQGLLEALDVPYVGAGVMASAISLDKLVFKELMDRAAVPQVDYRALRAEDDPPA